MSVPGHCPSLSQCPLSDCAAVISNSSRDGSDSNPKASPIANQDRVVLAVPKNGTHLVGDSSKRARSLAPPKQRSVTILNDVSVSPTGNGSLISPAPVDEKCVCEKFSLWFETIISTTDAEDPAHQEYTDIGCTRPCAVHL